MTEHHVIVEPGEGSIAKPSAGLLSERPSDRDRPLVTVLIPAYNEALKIMGSLTEIYVYMQALSDRYRFEILVIDDGSTDETAAIVDVFRADRHEVRMLRQPVNVGIGQALRDGFATSRGDVVIAFDSDLSYSVDHIGTMIETMQPRAGGDRGCVALYEGWSHERHPVARRHE